jgi:hypothetical protein
VACSLIIAFIFSITATLNQNIVEMMHEVDSSLQLVDYIFNVWGDSRLKGNDEECRLRICWGVISRPVMAARRLN